MHSRRAAFFDVPAFRLKKNLLCSLFSHKLKVQVSFGLVIMNRGTQGMNKQVGPAKKGSQNLILKLLEMLAISQFNVPQT